VHTQYLEVGFHTMHRCPSHTGRGSPASGMRLPGGPQHLPHRRRQRRRWDHRSRRWAIAAAPPSPSALRFSPVFSLSAAAASRQPLSLAYTSAERQHPAGEPRGRDALVLSLFPGERTYQLCGPARG
jgi:hypothetical protein